jgi:hypothetical protein
MPAPVHPSQTSGKRRLPKRPLSAKANMEMPTAASPDSERGESGHRYCASNGQFEAAAFPALRSDLDVIRELYEQRRDLLGVHSGMTTRMKAIVKTFYKLPPKAKISEEKIASTPYPPLITLRMARATIREHLDSLEADLEPYGKRLPAYNALWAPTRGLGPLGLALIAGEAGDLSKYGTHSQLWKRFGLHVGGGKAFYTKRADMSRDDWIDAGYSPRRRSVIYQITDSLLKNQLRKVTKDPGDERRVALGRYGEIYLARKQLEREKAKAEGLTVAPAADIPKKDARNYRSEGHIHNRAARYVGKKLLRDLWKVWRREVVLPLPKGQPAVASRSPSNSEPGGHVCDA